MPLTSDLQLDVSKFDPKNVSEQTNNFNEVLMGVMRKGPKWYEVGAERYRQMRDNGETPLPKPTLLSNAETSSLPSRSPDRSIPIRIFKPQTSSTPKGLFLHIHGGGWVLGAESHQDLMLQHYADNTSLTIVSVGYRLAPEHPYPAANEDCFDVANHLVTDGFEGLPLLFLGGDSAGAHLSVITCFELLEKIPNFSLRGLVLSYGIYDVAGFLPHVRNFDLPLILDADLIYHYTDAYLPNTTEEQRRNPAMSPLHKDLTKLKLPSAIFVCGTLDALLDDSILMSTKWAISGAESILKLYPGAPHGFTFFPLTGTEQTEQSLKDIETFVNDRI